MITKFGKRFLTSYLAGNNTFSSKDLAFGIGSVTPNAKGNDTRLNFEIYRVPVSISSFDIVQTGTDVDGDPIFAYTIIYRATIPQDVSGVISEIGLYPGVRTSTNYFDSKFVTAFENNLSWSDGTNSPEMQSNSDIYTAKIGDGAVKVQVASGQTKLYKCNLTELNLSGYSVNDSLAIAYTKADTHTSNITVNFYSSDTDYYSISFTPESGTGSKIQSLTLNNLFNNVTGNPDPANIVKIGISTTATGGATTVYYDGIRINDEDTFDPTYGIISRSVLNSPLVKSSGRPVDVEYKVQLEF